MIICIEGLTNSGKSTLCKLINGERKVTLVNDVIKNDIVTQSIKQLTGPVENYGKYDENVELLLYCTLLSVKAQSIGSIHGDILLDRFSLSVYSYFVSRYGMNDSFVGELVRYSSRNIKPDITFFLDVSLDTIIKRKDYSPFTRKDIGIEEYYSNLRECYITNIGNYSKKHFIIPCDSLNSSDVLNYVSACLDGEIKCQN